MPAHEPIAKDSRLFDSNPSELLSPPSPLPCTPPSPEPLTRVEPPGRADVKDTQFGASPTSNPSLLLSLSLPAPYANLARAFSATHNVNNRLLGASPHTVACFCTPTTCYYGPDGECVVCGAPATLPARCSSEHCVRQVGSLGANSDASPMPRSQPTHVLLVERDTDCVCRILECCVRAQEFRLQCGAHSSLPARCYSKHCVRRDRDKAYASEKALNDGTPPTLDPTPSAHTLEAEHDQPQCPSHGQIVRREFAQDFPDLMFTTLNIASLLDVYCDECQVDAALDPSGLEADNNPVRELDALHPRHQVLLRRSARLHDKAVVDRDAMDAAVPSPVIAKKRKFALVYHGDSPAEFEPLLVKFARKDTGRPRDRWLVNGALACPTEEWQVYPGACIALPSETSAALPLVPTTTPHATTSQPGCGTRRPHQRGAKSRGGKNRKFLANGEVNPAHLLNSMTRLLGRSDTVSTSTFSLVQDSSHSLSGFQGAPPPLRARSEIRRLFFKEPRAKALYPWLSRFCPVEYHRYPDTRQERATFIVDKEGRIFIFRSYRAIWLAELANEFADAIRILVGDDDRDLKIKASCANLRRGPHMPIIIGYQRQSSKEPYLTAWHRQHEDRVKLFMDQPVIKRVMCWIANVMRLIFPGVTQQMDADARWHKLKPPFAEYFWNMCLNARFIGQGSISTPPHADSKNQVLVCLMLIYELPGCHFNDDVRIWLAVWEVGLLIQLPAWVLIAYPSALLFHFNLDVDDIKFVTSTGAERPSRETARPITPGDADGRGSVVFFNQASMRTGPATGHSTFKKARANGAPTTIDFGDCIQTAFEKHMVLTPVPEQLRK